MYSSVQFLGTFAGAAAGGFLYSHFGIAGIVVPGVFLLAIWLILALSMQAPALRVKGSDTGTATSQALGEPAR